MDADENGQHDRPCDCYPRSGGIEDGREDKREDDVTRQSDQGRTQIKLGFSRTIIALVLVGAMVMVSVFVMLGYTQHMGETETYLVVTVWTGLTAIVGGMINSIFGVKEHHGDERGQK